MVLNVAARWGQRTVVGFDSGVIRLKGLVSEQGAVGHLLKTYHDIGIGLNTCVVLMIRDTHEGVFTFPLGYRNIWNKSGLRKKKQK